MRVMVGTPGRMTEAQGGIVAAGAGQLTACVADLPRFEGTGLFAAAVPPLL
jgi:hypothetical protein